MVVIARNCEQTGCRVQLRQGAAKWLDVIPHGLGAGKIITCQKDEFGPLTIDSFDRLFQARDIFVAVEMKVADLTSDYSAKLRLQIANGKIDADHLNLIDRSPPHPMQRPQRDWWPLSARMFTAVRMLDRPLNYLEPNNCHRRSNLRTVRVA